MKRRIVELLLVAFTVWPLVQHALVRHYDVNPWKLGGWAMYAQPHVAPETHLLVIREGRGVQLAPESWDTTLVRMARRYGQSRDMIGELAGPPDELGQKLLEQFPEEGVLVLIKLRHLDRSTDRFVMDLEQHLYLPDGTVRRGVRTVTEEDDLVR